MKVYKVLFQKSKKLFSINACLPNVKVPVQRYIRNQWTIPKIKNSKLMAFSDAQEALNFAYVFGGVVYEADVQNPQHKINGLNRILNVNYTHEFVYEEFWNEKIIDREHYFREIPRNTVFCDAIKITKPLTQ